MMSFTAKKFGTVSMTAAALLVASWGAQATSTDGPSTAIVHITATVTGNTCTPEWDGKGVEVNLGKVADTALSNVGDVGAIKPFTLHLKDCDSGVTKVVVTAMGQGDSGDSSAFANGAATGAANGVAVALYGGQTQLKPDGSTSAEYKVSDKAADMSFLAKLKRTADAGKGTKDGAVDSTATLYMTYE